MSVNVHKILKLKSQTCSIPLKFSKLLTRMFFFNFSETCLDPFEKPKKVEGYT